MSNWFKKTSFLPSKAKYKAIRAERAGRSFASQAEALLFDYLNLLSKDGQLTLIACQDHVYLTDARILYIPDFVIEENEQKIWCEMKGFETPEWRLKRKLWLFYGPGLLRVYNCSKGNIVLKETLAPKTSSSSQSR